MMERKCIVVLVCLSVVIPCFWGLPLDIHSSVGLNDTKSSISFIKTPFAILSVKPTSKIQNNNTTVLSFNSKINEKVVLQNISSFHEGKTTSEATTKVANLHLSTTLNNRTRRQPHRQPVVISRPHIMRPRPVAHAVHTATAMRRPYSPTRPAHPLSSVYGPFTSAHSVRPITPMLHHAYAPSVVPAYGLAASNYVVPKPAYRPATSAYRPAASAYRPATPAYSPVTPAYGVPKPANRPAASAYRPVTSAYRPTTPAYVPATPAYVPATPAYGPAIPAYGPTTPAAYGPATSAYVVAPPAYGSAVPAIMTYTPSPAGPQYGPMLVNGPPAPTYGPAAPVGYSQMPRMSLAMGDPSAEPSDNQR